MITATRQRGAALLVMVTVVVVGFAWFVTGALGRGAITQAERDAKTALALQAAKRALLADVAHYAARTDFNFPGRMRCPESLKAYGTANQGEAAGACSNATVEIGRLPWRTLGIEQLRDGDGEPLWYALSPGFHPVTLPSSPPLNFSTPAALPFDGTNVVAVVLAPGRALRSNPCNAVNQQSGRYTTPLDPAKFFECGNATGNYTNPGSTGASNDRVLAITKDEWIAAITGPIADRLQRQLAPALENFRTIEANANWGERYLPFASTFGNPATNNLCGNDGVREGLMPAALSANSTCTSWTNGNPDGLLALDIDDETCGQVAGVGLRCTFRVTGVGPLNLARIRARAENVDKAFRRPISAGAPDITSPQSHTIVSVSQTFDEGNGRVDLDIYMIFTFIVVNQWVTVDIRNLPDANLMSDPRAAWFFGNEWGRHTYYGIARGNRADRNANCHAGTKVPYEDCLTVTGAHGQPSDNDKHFLLALMGRALATQTQPSGNASDYVELRTGNSPDEFAWNRLSTTYNDRIAMCPFRYVDASGTPQSPC